MTSFFSKSILPYGRFIFLCLYTTLLRFVQAVPPAVLLVVLFAPQAVAAPYGVADVPNTRLTDADIYISNPDGLIDAREAAAINALLQTTERETGIEIAVVALKAVNTDDARTFAVELFERWGIGKKGKDNGLLILLVTEPPARSVTFEVGYGLEGVLPDVVCYRLQQKHMVPLLSAGKYSEAMLLGVRAVTDYLKASDSERDSLSRPAARPQANVAARNSFIVIVNEFALPVRYLRRRCGPRDGRDSKLVEPHAGAGRLTRRRHQPPLRQHSR